MAQSRFPGSVASGESESSLDSSYWVCESINMSCFTGSSGGGYSGIESESDSSLLFTHSNCCWLCSLLRCISSLTLVAIDEMSLHSLFSISNVVYLVHEAVLEALVGVQ